ncbi:glycoside hydrolase family 13 protein [Microbacterium hominis]|uniref:Glycoside hydrolase family 13 protein n=1 Tax=Microbacterium hominis TaxID=162426 RepID=A0A7D4UKJ9_9MICO|nr:glycoside hydrolase family 13 protein [Microbacterium hominis]QKJ20967.1 glycoside hydrolase family 13 protein [Microbacterium hominis]
MTTPLPLETDAATPAATWWRQATVYQIYPRSFADANGDGIGDIPGILSRIDYLAELGIDAVWLSPFYPSALADGGYDVADYRNVDPRLGTLDDFDAMVDALHRRGIRVVVDIVPNHTSDLHPWFQEALAAGRGSAARDRYIFRDGTGPDGSEPPADWVSVFGGPAWHRVEDGQWYFHNFAKEQPDLNWDNPEVHEDFITTLRFWSDRGVDGFRIDVAHMLTKDLTDPLPTRDELALIPIDGNHPLIDRDDVHEIYAEWRAVFNSYDPPRTAVAEAWVATDRVPRYASPESLGQSFNFALLQADFDAAQFRRIVTDSLELASRSGSSSTWVLSNHDVVRHATRYGLRVPDGGTKELIEHVGEWLVDGGDEARLDRARGRRRAAAASLFMLALPGSAYLYQGEELGLYEVTTIPADERQDPTFFRTAGAEIGRDGCRVPLPWTSAGSSFGFGDDSAHLPQPEWFSDLAVEAQTADASSMLSLYRRALSLRHELQSDEELEWIDTGRSDVLRFARPNGWQVITNFGSEPYSMSADDDVLLSSSPLAGTSVPAESTVWIGGHRG